MCLSCRNDDDERAAAAAATTPLFAICMYLVIQFCTSFPHTRTCANRICKQLYPYAVVVYLLVCLFVCGLMWCEIYHATQIYNCDAQYFLRSPSLAPSSLCLSSNLHLSHIHAFCIRFDLIFLLKILHTHTHTQ